jgi:hypothetical protein
MRVKYFYILIELIQRENRGGLNDNVFERPFHNKNVDWRLMKI